MIAADANWRRKGGKLTHMKYLAILVLATVALGLGACSNKSSTTHSTTTSASTGYSK